MNLVRPISTSQAAGPSTEAPRALIRTRPMIAAAMRRAVDTLSPELRRVVAYHLGWSDADGRETHGDGGKAVRPTITLLAAEAVGGSAEDAVPGAVALELVHNFSLLHDDVMDGDRERRHRPTVWALFGEAQAIIGGDALLALAHELLLDAQGPQAHRAAAELTRATAEMIEGQSLDLSFESRLDVSVEQCLAMTAKKTGALIGCAAAVGGLLGGGTEAQVDALRDMGRHVGLAFQAVDDVLGIWGEPAVTGKPAANDLRQRKKSLPVVHALSAGTPGAAELAGLVTNGELSEEDVARAVALVEEAGGRSWTLDLASHHLKAALFALERESLGPGPAGDLREVALFVVRRDF